MAYVAPRNWAIADPATAFPAQFNQDIRDNLSSLRAMNDVAIRVHRTATQSLANDTRVPISWQAAAYQTGVTWSSGTNPTRLTVPTNGRYLLVANIKYANNATGRRCVGWRANGGSTANDLHLVPANGVDTATGMEIINLTANDYIEVYGRQTSGGSLSTSGTTEGDVWAALSLFAEDDTPPLWTPPRTWATDDIGSPSMLNTHIRDNVLNLRNLKGAGAKCWFDEDQSISQNTRGPISWNQSAYNYGAVWDGGSRFTAPVDGIYLINIDVEWADTTGAGVQGVGYRVNESSTAHDLQFQEASSQTTNQSATDLIQLSAGDFLEFYAFQDSEESSTIHGGSEDRTRASVTLWAAAA